ncbi:phosphohydrolase [Sphingomonas sp. RHCKR7]|uniref:phosphonate degradation HD-domain oxygenase n=1 Tax=Sphingomonas folli TaxID=2862497 RepID=UPI001CA5B1E6|nr:phosphonate degradation HD-domain oxygenase [Sphingomonas folli]MBW6526467.1 phosphohydrolase [Sphingomonas folli]
MANVIDLIFDLFERHGHDHYGEDTTQLSHALQCAALARASGCADTLVAAALLHDIGQFIDEAGVLAERRGVDARHEDLGHALLSTHFPPAVIEPIRLHVAAKRYLCAVDPDYAATLSAASHLSLRLQGGAMSAAECAGFEREPFFADAVTLRRFDDDGKATDPDGADLASYRALLERVVVRAAPPPAV